MTVSDLVPIQLIGAGAVGRVYLTKRSSDNAAFAVKVVSKSEMIAKNKVRRALTEREILATADFPFIVSVYYTFTSHDNLYMAMEVCAGGEFYKLLLRQPHRVLPEPAARFYICEVLAALEYLHSIGFIYRDLKPENLLVHGSGHMRLCDFDLSARAVASVPTIVSSMWGGTKTLHNAPHILTNSFVGTEEYVAPEVVKGGTQSVAVDFWTLGVLLFEILYARTPFKGAEQDDTFANICRGAQGALEFPPLPLYVKEKVGSKYPTKACKDLIRRLLTASPSDRLGSRHGATDVKAHAFFESVSWPLLANEEPPIVPEVDGDFDTKYYRKLKMGPKELVRDFPHMLGETDKEEEEGEDKEGGDADPFSSFALEREGHRQRDVMRAVVASSLSSARGTPPPSGVASSRPSIDSRRETDSDKEREKDMEEGDGRDSGKPRGKSRGRSKLNAASDGGDDESGSSSESGSERGGGGKERERSRSRGKDKDKGRGRRHGRSRGRRKDE